MRAPAVLVIRPSWGLTSSFVDFGEALVEKGFVIGLADVFEGRKASDPDVAKRLRPSS
jgi:carboxymethylenebutenolidase